MPKMNVCSLKEGEGSTNKVRKQAPQPGSQNTTPNVGRNMETTVVQSEVTLTRFIVIKPIQYMVYAHYEGGLAVLGGESVFSEKVKIEVEQSAVNSRYVHLRFCHSNRYWARPADELILAEIKTPEEDTTNPWCTLFEVVTVDVGDGVFYLNHVQSGGRVAFENQPTLYVEEKPHPDQGFLTSVNWDTLVKLPKQVAFKGYNNRHLQAVESNWSDTDLPFLQFSADDPNKLNSGYEITLMPDGHVRILSNITKKYWRRDDNVKSSGWIWADSEDTTANNLNTLFWPVKLDDNTIALRNADNDNFCEALTANGKTDCLDASAPTISNEARLGVQELVSGRRIFNVRYRMEDSRIYNETPFVAGTTQAFNYSDSEAGIAVEVSYEDSRSHSFSRSLSLTAGVKASVEFGVPFIEKATIEVSFEINTTLQWNDTTTTTTSVKATGSVPVPPRSLATVSYVGTMGTCDVPFSYTQEDTSSTDGKITESEQIDGVFKGINAYNFSFVVEKTQALPA